MSDQTVMNSEIVKFLREQHGVIAMLNAKIDYALRQIDILTKNGVLTPPARQAMSEAHDELKSKLAIIEENSAIHAARLQKLFP